MGSIYRIDCLANGRLYIGSTQRINPRQRWLEHLHALRHNKHHSSHFQRAYIKHGEQAFAFTVIEHVEDNNFLLPREQFHMWRHPDDQLMNGIAVADAIYAAHVANRGRVQSAEERAMRSVVQKKAREGMDNHAKYTPEVRAKMSVSRKARVMPPMSAATKAKIGTSNSGKVRTQEHIERSVATRTSWIEDERPLWLAMRREGKSYRQIEAVTGRARKVLARECKGVV